MSEPTYDSLLTKLDEIKANLEKAARLKRQYEFTIGVLAGLVLLLLAKLLA